MSALAEDDELQAAELAFGLLDPPERQTAEARVERDADFAAAHLRWQARAIDLLAARDETPPEAVWRAILGKFPANDNLRATVRRWQVATVAASLIAAVLGTVALRDRPPPAPIVRTGPAPVAAPPLVAVLRGEDVGVVAVSYDATSGRLTVTPNELSVGARAAQLWVIPVGGKPASLGVIDARAAASRAAPSPQIVPGATLAVSVEPIGGSPTGQPTGPVILSGKVAET